MAGYRPLPIENDKGETIELLNPYQVEYFLRKLISAR